SLELFRALDDRLGIARALNVAGEYARLQGDYASASRNYHEALEIDQLLGNWQGMAVRLHNLGYVALYHGDVATSLRSFCDAFALDRELGYRTGPLSFLEGIAAVMSAADRPQFAARLYGAWEANCALPGTEFKLHPPDQREFERYTSRAAAALGRTSFAREWAAGRQLSLEQAIAEALHVEHDYTGGAIVPLSAPRAGRVDSTEEDPQSTLTQSVQPLTRRRPAS